MNKPMTSRPKLEGGHESDHFQTPDYAVAALVPYLKAAGIKTIWECAAGDGMIARYLESQGFIVYATDFLTGQDFLTHEPEFEFDAIVTNHPFSKKNDFYERYYYWVKKLGIKWAALNPITIKGELCRMFDKYGMQEITPYQRINFITPAQRDSQLDYYWRCDNKECKKVYRIPLLPHHCTVCGNQSLTKQKYTSQIKTVWHTHGLNLPKDRVYVDLEKYGYPDQGDWKRK